MGFARGELPQTHWPFGKDGKVQLDGVMSSNDLTLLVEAAVHGLGIAMLPRMFVLPLIEQGALVQVLAGVLEVEAQIAVVYPEREFVPPQVRAFVEALVAWAKVELDEKVVAARCTEALKAHRGKRPRRR
jgi:DNA-binding transcriptional LysR family regulator